MDGCKRPLGLFLAIPNPAALLASSTAKTPYFIMTPRGWMFYVFSLARKKERKKKKEIPQI